MSESLKRKIRQMFHAKGIIGLILQNIRGVHKHLNPFGITFVHRANSNTL